MYSLDGTVNRLADRGDLYLDSFHHQTYRAGSSLGALRCLLPWRLLACSEKDQERVTPVEIPQSQCSKSETRQTNLLTMGFSGFFPESNEHHSSHICSNSIKSTRSKMDMPCMAILHHHQVCSLKVTAAHGVPY